MITDERVALSLSFLLFLILVCPSAPAERWVVDDFEVGPFRAWAWGNGSGKITDVEISQEKAHAGKGCLKMSWDFGAKPAAGEFAAVGHAFSGHGAPSRYTFWIHGDRSGVRLIMYIRDATGEVFVHTVGTVDWEGWREFTVPMASTPIHYGGNGDGKADPPGIVHDIAIEWQPGAKPRGTIYIDDVSMETTIPPCGDATIGLAGPTFAAQNATVPFHFTATGFRNPPEMEFKVTAELLSTQGKRLDRGDQVIRLNDGKAVTVPIPLRTPGARGVTVRVRLHTPSGQVLSESSGTVLLLPDVSTGQFEPDSVFGLAFNSNPHDSFVTGAFKWLRMDFDYPQTAAFPDRQFAEEAASFDAALERCETNKVMVLGILNPRGFILAYPAGKVPLATWADFVRRVVGRYKGRVKYWEICNEPNTWQMPEVYVAMAKTAYIVGKQVDPECSFGAFDTACVDLSFIEVCLKAGMADYFDFVSVHPYQWSHSFNDRLLLNDIEGLERLLKRYQCNRPIWISEIGWPTHPKGGSPINVQGDIVGQLYLTVAGLEKYKTFLYSLGDWPGDPADAETSFGIFDAAGRPKPAFYSYYVTSKLLSQARSLGRATLPEGLRGWRYLLPDGRLALSVWRERGEPSNIRLVLPGLKGTQVQQFTMDLQRKTLTAVDGTVAVAAGTSPLILVYATAARHRPASRPPLTVSPKTANPIFLTALKLLTVFPGQQGILPFGLVNLTSTRVERRVFLKLPAEWGGATLAQAVSAAPGAETPGQFVFSVPSRATGGRVSMVLKAAGCTDLSPAVEVGSRIAIDVEPVNRPLGDHDVPLTLIIANDNSEKTTGTLMLRLPAGVILPNAHLSLDLAPRQSVTVHRTIQGLAATGEPWLDITGLVGPQRLDFRRRIDNTYTPRAQNIVIDGNLNDWRRYPCFHLERIEQVQQIKTWWTGPEDLSARVHTAWDETYFYFAADVTDDVHCQRSVGGSTWLGDGFQLAFEAGDKYAYELCLALTNEGPQLYALRTLSGRTGFVPGAKAAASRFGKHTFYETAIPWAALPPLTGRAGAELGFNFILNENDGTTREGYLECRPGIGSGKSPVGWYRWRLGE